MYVTVKEPVASVQCRWKLPHSKLGEGFLFVAGTGETNSPVLSLIDLPELAFLSVALALDEQALCNLDCICQAARDHNKSPSGPWRALGLLRFTGVELSQHGKFELDLASPLHSRPPFPVDWRRRYGLFAETLPTFRAPHWGREIIRFDHDDEVVYCQCMVVCEQRPADDDVGVYIEFCVYNNPDNFSIALVDFEAGGHSSLTFSPDTGAVIRHCNTREQPRMVEGAYVQPLRAYSGDESNFEGSVGIYVNAGHIAFFRRRAKKNAQQHALWEATGYIADFSWAESPSVTPCIAIRDAGDYHMRLVGVGRTPPMDFGAVPTSYDESSWTRLSWEASDADDML